MTSGTETREFSFQAEIKQLLHLLAHSLYQSRDIAMRELISNASDALDKLKHLSLTDAAVQIEDPLEIKLIADKEAGTLIIADNGIGMSDQELESNLGTIAKSGSLEFLSHLTGDAKKDVSLIGQFGVGFYAAFMLADRVEVRSRSYADDAGWVWESDGTGRFTIAPYPDLPRGTQVVLHLKDDLKDFADDFKLRQVIRTYSSFIPHPIKIGDEIVNDVKPIWVEPKSQLTDEQYTGFYRHLTHHASEEPLWHLHFSTDSPIQFHAILYCPPTNPERLGFGRPEHGLHLCAKRVLVQNDCREILPEYLRFLHGLVDSEDLPLNVSRETLQDLSVFQKIRRLLVKKVLDRLSELAEKDPPRFQTFTEQFGNAIKEGVGLDFENRDKIASLLRFPSTRSEDGKLVSLDDYVSRVSTDQKKIYYMTGPSVASMNKHPHLEIFRRRQIEVLLLPEPIDEWVMTHLGKYRDLELQSADSADLDLPAGKEEESKEEQTPEPDATGFSRVLDIIKKTLGTRVKEVRRSDRLVDSPACLVNPDGSLSTQMQKIMMLSNKEFEAAPRILEINPRAKIVRRLCDLSANPSHEPFIAQVGEQLFSHCLLAEGLLTDPQSMVERMMNFMEESAQSRSPIITS